MSGIDGQTHARHHRLRARVRVEVRGHVRSKDVSARLHLDDMTRGTWFPEGVEVLCSIHARLNVHRTRSANVSKVGDDAVGLEGSSKVVGEHGLESGGVIRRELRIKEAVRHAHLMGGVCWSPGRCLWG